MVRLAHHPEPVEWVATSRFEQNGSLRYAPQNWCGVAIPQNQAMVARFLLKIKSLWEDFREDLIWAVFIFLLVTFAFGLGFVFGSRFYEDAAINISCPAYLFESGQVPKIE
jgi:hypothetical protein